MSDPVRRLAHVWRHPIKGIGSEALQAARLTPDGALEGDRRWALLTDRAPDVDTWQPRRSFLQVASGPGLAAVTAESRPDGRLALRHPACPELSFDPEAEPGALAPWVVPIWPEERPRPARLVRAPGHGMTDMAEPFVSLGSLTALRALSQRLGRPVDMRRFRINLWIEGLAPGEEAEWVGARLSLGPVVLEGAEPVERCRAPDADPETGRRDVAMMALLGEAGMGRDFGLYLRVIEGGDVTVGDALALLP